MTSVGTKVVGLQSGAYFSHSGTQVVINIPKRDSVVDTISRKALTQMIEKGDPAEVGRAKMTVAGYKVTFDCEGVQVDFYIASVLGYLAS